MSKQNAVRGEALRRRHDIMADLISQGVTQKSAIAFVKEKYPDWQPITDRQLCNYYKAAEVQLGKEIERLDRRALAMRSIKRLENLYERFVKVNDLKGALAADMELRKLLRLDNLLIWQDNAPERGSLSDLTEIFKAFAVQAAEPGALPAGDVIEVYPIEISKEQI